MKLVPSGEREHERARARQDAERELLLERETEVCERALRPGRQTGR